MMYRQTKRVYQLERSTESVFRLPLAEAISLHVRVVEAGLALAQLIAARPVVDVETLRKGGPAP